jgi:hypothetical protein
MDSVGRMTEQAMDDDIRDMALRCFGYGRWSAPYWFIGPGKRLRKTMTLSLV